MKAILFPVSFRGILASALLLATVGAAHAATAAKGSISNTDLGGGVFQYTITLTNTGSTSIETFWYAWEPGADFLATSPTNIQSPAGWSAFITGGGPNDGFAIQWVTSSAPLAPGNSATFVFESTDTPAQIAGKSVFFPSTPVGTSFVYQGAPFSGGSAEFVVGGTASPSAPVISIKRPSTFSTAASKIVLRGQASGSSSVTYRIGSHSAKTATGTAHWHFKVTLRKGENVVTIIAHGPGGASAPAKVIITRT